MRKYSNMNKYICLADISLGIFSAKKDEYIYVIFYPNFYFQLMNEKQTMQSFTLNYEEFIGIKNKIKYVEEIEKENDEINWDNFEKDVISFMKNLDNYHKKHKEE